MTYLLKVLGSALISIGLFFGAHQIAAPSFGATSATPIQTSPTSLSGAGVTNSATTINLTSFVLPDPNKTPVQMSMLGSIGYAVLEPQSSKVENISFTGITQNTNGSATLTGVSRGLSFYAPYAASTTLSIAHSGGAQLILSNSAAFYGQQFAFINNPETINGVWTFGSTTPPGYDFNPNFNALASTTFASIGFVASTSYAGVVNATSLVKGIVQLATAFQAASSTATGSTGALLVLPASIATDTPQSNGGICNSTIFGLGGCVIMSDLTGKIRQGWLDLTATWNFSGLIQSSGTSLGFLPIYGDGSDSASTTAASYSLTRDEYFTNYTVSSGNTITTNGYRIYATGTLTVNGTIAENGGNGSTGTAGGTISSSGNGAGGAGGAGGAPAVGSGGTLALGPVGGAGAGGGAGSTNTNTGGSVASTPAAQLLSFLTNNGVNGGASGAGTSVNNVNCPGSVCTSTGAATSTGGTTNQVAKPNTLFSLWANAASSTQPFYGLSAPSAGGSGGAGGVCGTNTGTTSTGGGGGGGGAGAGGGYIFIAAKTIVVGASGSIKSNGGNGGTGGAGGGASGGSNCNTTGGGGGGGGGGNGGLIVLIYNVSYTNGGTVQAIGGSAGAGGAPGSGATGGNAGVAGNSGTVQTLQY